MQSHVLKTSPTFLQQSPELNMLDESFGFNMFEINFSPLIIFTRSSNRSSSLVFERPTKWHNKLDVYSLIIFSLPFK